MKIFDGKVAIVTGAGGIGSMTAKAFAAGEARLTTGFDLIVDGGSHLAARGTEPKD